MFFILLGVMAVAAISLATIVAELRRAPEAYEDEHGFHILRGRAVGSSLLHAEKYAKGHSPGALKPARSKTVITALEFPSRPKGNSFLTVKMLRGPRPLRRITFLNNTDPNLWPLQNGGPTETMALLPGSPAIDGGNPGGCTNSQGHLLRTDQRAKTTSQQGRL